MLRFLQSKLRPAVKPVVSQAASAPVPPPAASPLLRDVLGGTVAFDRASQSSEKKGTSSPLSQRLSVGARLADAKRRSIDAASVLIALSDADTGRAIDVLVEVLKKRVCSIAFAGQVKAGKSSLINVLVEEPDLLPADINPWTTVITRMHFGVPGKPQSGASFTFFNRDEWRRLSIGGRTRVLTERLFPDFDWEALSSQVQAMQERASRKLGPLFEELLGTEHIYPEITPGLLNRYVGAGHPDAEGFAAGAEGEYSDITKLADVFLDLAAFTFPTILIDTPGVNDPFLIRDEITRQNLEAADICVIVLTARQPLSSTDLSLLRMLRGLKKDRIIIFINKIDEISGGEEVLREVSHRVTTILKEELPSAQIPIVLGSASWARKALSFGTTAHCPPATPVNGIREDFAAFEWLSHSEIAGTVTAETLFQKSGLSSLAVAVSDMMHDSPIAAAIHATESLLEEVCRNLISWLETEIGILGKIPADLVLARSELAALVALRAALAAEFDTFSDSLAAIRAQKLSVLHRELTGAIEASAAEALAALPDDAIAAQASQIDAKLRVKLESVFLTAVEDAGNRIAGEQERLKANLTRLFEETSFKQKPAAILGQVSTVSPSLNALSEPAALGLTESLREFASCPIPAQIQSADLSRIILVDFRPIIENLAIEAARVLQETSDTLIHQVKALTLGPVDIAIRHIDGEIQKTEANSADTFSDPQSLDHKVQALHETISRLRQILTASQHTVPD
ncbi:MAG: dynamin family protein [Rhodomicrobium sp.]